MPRPNKRKQQLAVQRDAIAKRRKASPLLEDRLIETKEEDSSPINAVVGPDTINSLHGNEECITPIATAVAEAEAATNTALPDVVTSLPLSVANVDAATDGDAHATASNDSMTNTQPSNHPRATEVSTSAQEIKIEPVIKTEAAPAPASANPTASTHTIKLEPVVKTETEIVSAPANAFTDQAEAPISTESTVTNGPNLNRTVTVHRKAAKRTCFLKSAPPSPPQSIVVPLVLSPSPQAEGIPARQKPRVKEESFTTTSTDEAARKTATPDILVGIPTPPATPPCTDAVNTWTRRQSRRQIELSPIETSEAQLDGDDDDDDADEASTPRDSLGSSWELRLRELADYCKIHGHCNVPQQYIENKKLGHWVANQRKQYKLQQKGKKSFMTTSRIRELEKLGFEWNSRSDAWDDRLSELAAFRKIHGHCNVPKSYSENTKLGKWVQTQRKQYKCHLEEKPSQKTLFRIQALEGLGFEWNSYDAVWDYHLSELADYRNIHGHCNVPRKYSGNTKLAYWVRNQRQQYRLHVEEKKSFMTTHRIQALENLDFQWDSHGAAWKKSLSELAAYRRIHGHCNVPTRCSENASLGKWVAKQRRQYKLHLQEKTSLMTTYRIQELESLGFE
jgi:hypothetical protein